MGRSIPVLQHPLPHLFATSHRFRLSPPFGDPRVEPFCPLPASTFRLNRFIPSNPTRRLYGSSPEVDTTERKKKARHHFRSPAAAAWPGGETMEVSSVFLREILGQIHRILGFLGSRRSALGDFCYRLVVFREGLGVILGVNSGYLRGVCVSVGREGTGGGGGAGGIWGRFGADFGAFWGVFGGFCGVVRVGRGSVLFFF